MTCSDSNGCWLHDRFGRAAMFTFALHLNTVRAAELCVCVLRGSDVTVKKLHTSFMLCETIEQLLFVWWKAWKLSSVMIVWSEKLLVWTSCNVTESTSTHRHTDIHLEKEGLSRKTLNVGLTVWINKPSLLRVISKGCDIWQFNLRQFYLFLLLLHLHYI